LNNLGALCAETASLPNRRQDSEQRSHAVQFYSEETFLLDQVSRFIGSALTQGGGAIVIATGFHREAFAQRLKASSLDTAAAAAKGRYVSMDASETLAQLMMDGRPDEARFADVIGRLIGSVAVAAEGRRIAVFGEMVALLCAQDKPEAAVLLEQLWNKLARSHSFSLRCAYPISAFNRGEHGDLLQKICAEHSDVIPSESYSALSTEQERLRTIAYLQQKALALQAEMSERRRIEQQLRGHQAELESKIEQRTAALRQLSSRLLNLQDAERRRIARELHDSLGQYLVALKLNVNMLRGSPGRTDLWLQSEELMERSLSEVRTLSYLLHPPTIDTVGIVSAARWYIEGFGLRSGLKLTLDAPNEPIRVADAVELALFRVLQEALTNVHRHSGASAAEIVIRRAAKDKEVVLEVKDNGCGMDRKTLEQFLETGNGAGVGLLSMHERARELGGRFELESDKSGTVVRITIAVASACLTASC